MPRAELVAALRRHAANAVTLGRTALLFVALAASASGSPGVRLAAVPVAVLVVALDAADGRIARRLGTCTRLGAVLDVASDRIVETVWWIWLAAAGGVPVAVPVVVVTRGIVVDTLRSLQLARGKTAFGERGMMQTWMGRALVSSRWSRAVYGTAKGVVFPLLFLVRALPPGALGPALPIAASVLVWTTLLFCVVRALPVVLESAALLKEEASTS